MRQERKSRGSGIRDKEMYVMSDLHDAGLDRILKAEQAKMDAMRRQLDQDINRRKRGDEEFERRNRRALAAIAALEEALAAFKAALRSEE
jgi:hypothetical protein